MSPTTTSDQDVVFAIFCRVGDFALTPAQLIAALILELECGGSRASDAELDVVIHAPRSTQARWHQRAQRAIDAAVGIGTVRVRRDGCLVRAQT